MKAHIPELPCLCSADMPACDLHRLDDATLKDMAIYEDMLTPEEYAALEHMGNVGVKEKKVCDACPHKGGTCLDCSLDAYDGSEAPTSPLGGEALSRPPALPSFPDCPCGIAHARSDYKSCALNCSLCGGEKDSEGWCANYCDDPPIVSDSASHPKGDTFPYEETE